MANDDSILKDDENPKGLIPAVEFLLLETQRHALSETSHYLEVAVEALKDELAERKTNMH